VSKNDIFLQVFPSIDFLSIYAPSTEGGPPLRTTSWVATVCIPVYYIFIVV